MRAVDLAISEIEELAGHDIQARNIAPLAAAVRGSLGTAAASIATHPNPNIVILTGFFLGHGDPPNCETDGPPGAVMLATGFAAAGVPCRVVTDRFSERVLKATAAAAPVKVPVDIASMHDDGRDGGIPIDALTRTFLAGDTPVSHVIAIERCGPSRDGRPRDARGEDIASNNAPLEKLFSGGPWTKIGIGDLGNEIGMGSLPPELVSASVLRGGQLWCTVACDHPIVCGISNWAGSALLVAAALLRPGRFAAALESTRPEFALQLLEAAVRDGGAVSGDGLGGIPRSRYRVDGMTWSRIEPTFRRIHEIGRDAMQYDRPEPAVSRMR
jgi:hypothetical protein